MGRVGGTLEQPPAAYVTAVLAPRGGELCSEADVAQLLALGAFAAATPKAGCRVPVGDAMRHAAARAGVREVRMVDSDRDAHGRVLFQPVALVEALREVVESYRAAAAERHGYHI